MTACSFWAPVRPCQTSGMGLYGDQILPRAIDLTLRSGVFAGPRARVAAGLEGEVLEIGFGSGLNIPGRLKGSGPARRPGYSRQRRGRRQQTRHGPRGAARTVVTPHDRDWAASASCRDLR